MSVFVEAEAAIADLDARVTTLEAAPVLQTQIDALTATVASQAALITALDARLDAIAAGAVG